MKFTIESKYNIGDNIFIALKSNNLNDISSMPVYLAEIIEIRFQNVKLDEDGLIKSNISYVIKLLNDNILDKRVNWEETTIYEYEAFSNIEEALEVAEKNTLNYIEKASSNIEDIKKALEKINLVKKNMLK